MAQNLNVLLSRVFLLGFLLAFALGLNYLNAWTAPTQAPPGGNVAAPLNTGGTLQGKSGGLTLGSTLDIGSSLTVGGVPGDGPYLIDMGAATEGATSGIRFPDDTVQLTAGGGSPMGQLFHVVDQKTAGTAGGTCTAGVANTRVLNTLVTNDIGPSATLSGNQFTLPAGTYYVEASAPGYMVSRHKAILTGGSITMYGTSEMANNGPNAHTASLIRGKFTIASPTTFSIQHRCESTISTEGLGRAVNLAGWPEVYTVVSVWKLD